MSEKEMKRQVIKIGVFITSIFVLLLSVTYAFINVRLAGEKKQVIRAGELSLELEEDENNLTITNALPMYDDVGMIQAPFTFRLMNNGDEVVQYVLKLVKIKQENELAENLVRFHLTKDKNIFSEVRFLVELSGSMKEYSMGIRQEVLRMCHDAFDDRNITTEEECMNALKEVSEPYNSFDELIAELIEFDELSIDRDVLILDTGIIKGKQMIEYEYRMWLDSSIEDETLIKNKSLSYKIEVSVSQTDQYYVNMLKERLSEKENDKEFGYLDFEDNDFYVYKNDITYIVLENKINIPDIVPDNKKWDMSVNGDETVMAYLETIEFSENIEKYKLHIQANGKIYGNINSSGLFYGFTNLENISGLEFLDTSRVTNMSYMFRGYSSSQPLNLSGLDTSNVTDMNYMFGWYSSDAPLDLSNFDTSKVMDMSKMFFGYSSNYSLDLSSLNTSNVIDMSYMFSNYSSNQPLDLLPLDTSSVINMERMFEHYSSSQPLYLSNFDTSSVRNMGAMFYSSKLLNLDLSNFDTSNVVDMHWMFSGCRNLASLNQMVLTRRKLLICI